MPAGSSAPAGSDAPTRSNVVARFDAAVERAVDGMRSPTLDHVFYGLSAAADHSKLWHTLGWARGVVTGDRAEARRMSSALAIESFVTNVLVKSLVGRVRPERPVSDEPLLYGMRVPITSSFPSGHATAAFTAAVFLSDDDRGLAPLWFGLAGAVAFSRIYVRMHHPSDALAGAALGVALGATLHRILAPR
jgi:undecaprenyl-diphosphatase